MILSLNLLKTLINPLFAEMMWHLTFRLKGDINNLTMYLRMLWLLNIWTKHVIWNILWHFREADNNLFAHMIMIFVTLNERSGTADIAYSHLLRLAPVFEKEKTFGEDESCIGEYVYIAEHARLQSKQLIRSNE